ncbi:hypothetical protein LCGC14_2519990 [marine sediment metagenome]|uniref:Uncharacterized protein n=1 Tax=marine sediment metagenome TaxID=412755 RepID=A0A0F9DPY0_9ZZZZ
MTLYKRVEVTNPPSPQSDEIMDIEVNACLSPSGWNPDPQVRSSSPYPSEEEAIAGGERDLLDAGWFNTPEDASVEWNTNE